MVWEGRDHGRVFSHGVGLTSEGADSLHPWAPAPNPLCPTSGTDAHHPESQVLVPGMELWVGQNPKTIGLHRRESASRSEGRRRVRPPTASLGVG